MIRTLDPSKAHGYDRKTIHMLKLCDNAICKPLHIIYMSTLEKTFFAINNFVEGLKSNRKLIADDSALFFVVKDIDSSQIKLDVHQTKNKCVYQWKMNSNPDTPKQAQEIVFS